MGFDFICLNQENKNYCVYFYEYQFDQCRIQELNTYLFIDNYDGERDTKIFIMPQFFSICTNEHIKIRPETLIINNQ